MSLAAQQQSEEERLGKKRFATKNPRGQKRSSAAEFGGVLLTKIAPHLDQIEKLSKKLNTEIGNVRAIVARDGK